MGGLQFPLLMCIMFFFAYFILIRPAQNQEKARKLAIMKGLKKGDDVTFAGGILGTVVSIKEYDQLRLLKRTGKHCTFDCCQTSETGCTISPATLVNDLSAKLTSYLCGIVGRGIVNNNHTIYGRQVSHNQGQ